MKSLLLRGLFETIGAHKKHRPRRYQRPPALRTTHFEEVSAADEQ